MPNKSTVFRWLADQEAFRDQYARAREAAADSLADDILEIADDGRHDYVETDLGDGVIGSRVDHDHIARSRLRVDTRKWLASKLKPKKYGESVKHEVGGTGGGPIRIELVDLCANSATPET